jgi:hypothetical protein
MDAATLWANDSRSRCMYCSVVRIGIAGFGSGFRLAMFAPK